MQLRQLARKSKAPSLKEASLGCLLFACLLFVPNAGAAPEVEVLTPLSFGTLAITGNSTSSVLRVPRTGRNVSVTGSLVQVDAARPGHYVLTGFPANTAITVEADPTELSAGGTGIPGRLAVNQYDFSSVTTNQLGEAELQLGASFTTSTEGGSYEDAPYSGSTQLRFIYWEPQLGDYARISKNLTFTGQVRSSLEFNEVGPLKFGTLFAQGSGNDVASLRLRPTGEIDIFKNGEARMLSLSPPAPAVLRVTAAAAYHELTISVQIADTELRHASQAAGPRFTLSDLTTLPANTGTTDQNGQLEIRVGGTLSTQKAAGNVVYPAGTYQGTYSLTVSY